MMAHPEGGKRGLSDPGKYSIRLNTPLSIHYMSRATYDSDLTNEQWKIIEPFLNERHPLGWGRPRLVNTREVVNAIFYLLKTGCQWRSLPHDFPRWPVVF